MNQYAPLGFFKSLFDFSFTHFITTKAIKWLYGGAIILDGILALVVLLLCAFAGFQESPGAGVFGLIGGLIAAPVVFLLAVICHRLYFEVLVVLFRIAEHVAEIASFNRKSE